jgi:hypothetical protein
MSNCATAAARSGLYAGTNKETGEVEVSKTIGLRLSEFWRDHPPEQGWALVTSGEVSAILLPGNGVSWPCACFVCTVTKAGATVAQASSLAPITGNKSWESGETNAVSRVLNFLGYGRQEIEVDEANQEQQMKDLLATGGVTGHSPQHGVSLPEGVQTPQATSSNSDAKPETAKPRFPDPVAPQVRPAPTAVPTDLTSYGVRQTVVDQTVQRAKVMGLPVPEGFANKAEFDAWRKSVVTAKAGGA